MILTCRLGQTLIDRALRHPRVPQSQHEQPGMFWPNQSVTCFLTLPDRSPTPNGRVVEM